MLHTHTHAVNFFYEPWPTRYSFIVIAMTRPFTTQCTICSCRVVSYYWVELQISFLEMCAIIWILIYHCLRGDSPGMLSSSLYTLSCISGDSRERAPSSDSAPIAVWPETRWQSNGRITWWRHKMETFAASPVNSPHKGQWRGAWCFLWSAPEHTIK